MPDNRQPVDEVVFSAVATTGFSTEVDVSNQQNIQVCVAVTGACTVKFAGSIVDKGSVDFASAQAPSNMWDYVAANDLEDPSTIITGDDGVTFSGADCRQFIINVAGLRSFAVQVSAYTAGAVTARVFACNNQ